MPPSLNELIFYCHIINVYVSCNHIWNITVVHVIMKKTEHLHNMQCYIKNPAGQIGRHLTMCTIKNN